MLRLFMFLAVLGLSSLSFAQSPIVVEPLGSHHAWQRAEFRVTGVPAVTNPFDPEVIQVDATITTPGAKSFVVPAFWYQPYQRALNGGREGLTQAGAAHWRVRFCPQETGVHTITVAARTNGALHATSPSADFTVTPATNPLPISGFARVAPQKQYLETSRGDAIRLVGHNVCWHHDRGTFDYDDWFGGMANAGENFARLWMWPHAFGLETDKTSLNRYRLDRAWQLDYVLDLAERKGIYILLCLDYHGMFEQKPDYWGGNNYWVSHPYNATNGGPALNQNAFFTHAQAQKLYQKRLRYLVARYGYSPSLLAWEFFNEIDNVYSYLTPADVASWHRTMAQWLRANDPFGHMVTTSLTGNSDRQEIWQIPELDFSAYHSYNEPQPAARLAAVAQSFLSRYKKPVMIGEFGIDWRGWNRTNDPYLRGFRQGLWGGAVGGSLGSTMSWWWENIHSENAYSLYTGMTNILGRTAWGRGAWTNVSFLTSGPPPAQLADPIAGGEPFKVTLAPGGGWGAKPSGRLAVANPAAAGFAAANLNSFFHGTGHPELKVPFRLEAWLTNDARLVLHLNSVSSGAILQVRANGTELFRTNLPNLDGGYNVNNEYNLDLAVSLPPGKRLIEISNPGGDWYYLDWVRLEGVLPAAYQGNWQPSPDAIGLSSANEALIYVIAPGVAFPASATNSLLPRQENKTVILTNFPPGPYVVDWFMPTNGAHLRTDKATAKDGALTLEMPPFYEDLVGRVTAPPKLSALGPDSTGAFMFELHSAVNERFAIETSPDLSAWSELLRATNAAGRMTFMSPGPATNPAAFFRARRG